MSAVTISLSVCVCDFVTNEEVLYFRNNSIFTFNRQVSARLSLFGSNQLFIIVLYGN